MHFPPPLAVLCLAFCFSGTRGADIEIERVFGPGVPGKYKHPASIAQLQNGHLVLIYNESMSERTPLTARTL